MTTKEKTVSPEQQEQLRQKFNPDGSVLRTIQLNLTDILIEFDRVCRKNGIQYWLDLGTLLGAARHKGFIPWDDDLDICIMKKDHKKLVKALKKDLQEPFSFIDANTPETNPRRWARVLNTNITIARKYGTSAESGEPVEKEENIWLDVFLMINATVKSSRMIDPFFGRCYRRRYNSLKDGGINHIIGICLYPFARLLVQFMYLWGRIFWRDCFVYDYGSGFYALRKSADIFPLSQLEFEGHQFPAPLRYDDYLKRIYGDWEKVPDPDKINNHNILRIVKQTSVTN